jgi:hypothetical protein
VFSEIYGDIHSKLSLLTDVFTDLSAVSVKIKVEYVLRRNYMFYVEASLEMEAVLSPKHRFVL